METSFSSIIFKHVSETLYTSENNVSIPYIKKIHPIFYTHRRNQKLKRNNQIQIVQQIKCIGN